MNHAVERQEGHPACKNLGRLCYGGGVAVSSVGVAPTCTVGASASIFFLCSTKPRRIFMMAYNSDIGLDPVGDPTCLRKQKVGKPSRNATQPYAKAEGCVYEDPFRADGLRKGWPFRVGTWNVESLTGRSGELVEALGERRIDIATSVCAGNSVER